MSVWGTFYSCFAVVLILFTLSVEKLDGAKIFLLENETDMSLFIEC